MYHIPQQACNTLLSNELKAGRWRFIYMYLPAIYQPSAIRTQPASIEFRSTLLLYLLKTKRQ